MRWDIHIALEKFVNEKWVMVERLHEPSVKSFPLFAALVDANGSDFPMDASESTLLWKDEIEGDDFHSYSSMYVVDAAPIFVEHMRDFLAYAKKDPYDFFFNIQRNDNPFDYRIVFWFES